MLLYLIFLPLSLLMSIVCYITNPIVLLFCNIHGELPFFLHLWQTWDNSCNPSDIKSMLPKSMTYWWDDHYIEYEDTIKSANRTRWKTKCINENFTIKERVLIYLCRLYWLTRNCSYGWSFYTFGVEMAGKNMKIYKQTEDCLFANYWLSAFIYKDDGVLFSAFGYDVKKCFFMGWKIDMSADIPSTAMIANRIAFRFRKQK